MALDTNVLVRLLDASAACFVPITVELELEWQRQGMDFADALHLARSEGCSAMISFDRHLALIAGQLNLQPTVKSP